MTAIVISTNLFRTIQDCCGSNPALRTISGSDPGVREAPIIPLGTAEVRSAIRVEIPAVTGSGTWGETAPKPPDAAACGVVRSGNRGIAFGFSGASAGAAAEKLPCACVPATTAFAGKFIVSEVAARSEVREFEV